ncbi:hypothetical protein [Clostridium ganghwense]|uniref:Uncharacterized protein n=1 Tax=Clostridium ganghwense TaxID=312089 RepID=A0ABT4CK96_9CLOT|nr:hypothetical protein [Clostridium ganghwense]MCY6369477.1 hypothetical protein [Clostridium ganghwense]
MEKLLKPITREEFNSIKKIAINNIDEGFKNYTNGVLDVHDHALTLAESNELLGSVEKYNLKYEERFINFMKKIYNLNKNKPIIVDFYLKDIDNAGILRVLNYLDYDDKLTFINHVRNLNSDSVYFLLDNEELIPFITKLSTRELHFCTLHFMEIPLTVWGNYDLSFPVFFREDKDVSFYEKIARENNLFIRDIKYI